MKLFMKLGPEVFRIGRALGPVRPAGETSHARELRLPDPGPDRPEGLEYAETRDLDRSPYRRDLLRIFDRSHLGQDRVQVPELHPVESPGKARLEVPLAVGGLVEAFGEDLDFG